MNIQKLPCGKLKKHMNAMWTLWEIVKIPCLKTKNCYEFSKAMSVLGLLRVVSKYFIIHFIGLFNTNTCNVLTLNLCYPGGNGERNNEILVESLQFLRRWFSVYHDFT